MRLFRPALVFACILVFVRLGAAEDAPATGGVEGRVALPAAGAAPEPSARYELIVEPGLVRTDPPRAIVYLEGTFPPAVDTPVARIVQRDLAFVPGLLPVRVGTRVEFPNEDKTYHNVFSFSRPKRFDLGRYRADEAAAPFQIFDQAGLVTLRCDIHEHMRAAVLVLDTPFFVVTDADGRFRLEGVPAGKFTLKAWIDSRTTRALPVEISAGQILRADLP